MSASKNYDAEIARLEREIHALERKLDALGKRTARLEGEVDAIRRGVKGILEYLDAISEQINAQLRVSTKNLKTTEKLNKNLEEFREKDFPSYQRNLLLALAVMDTTIIGAIIGAEKLRERARLETLKRFSDYLEKEVHYAREAYRHQLETIMKDYLNFIDDMFTQFTKMVEGELHLFERLTLALRDVQEFYQLLEPERIDTEVYRLALEADFARRMHAFSDLAVALQEINTRIAEASTSSQKILSELEARSIELPGLDDDTVLYLPTVLLEVEVGGETHTVLLGPRLSPDQPTGLEKKLLEHVDQLLSRGLEELGPQEKARLARRLAQGLRDPEEKKALIKALAG